MPYITPEEREPYKVKVAELLMDLCGTPKGHLNYVVTLLAWEWAKSHGGGYTNISNAIGALQDAAEEMRRRKLGPYEDEKIAENGDAYDDVDELFRAIVERRDDIRQRLKEPRNDG